MSVIASYFKCALQVNSYSYSKFRGKAENDEEEYNRQIVDRCLQNNISVVGLADHGSVDATLSLRNKLEENGIVVFPGFELSTAEKMHIVCLFSPECDNSELNRYLGVLGLTKVEKGTESSNLSCLEIAHKIKELGGFWYAAHITNDNGILRIGKLQHIWKSEELVAAQIPRTKDDIDPNYKNIISNTDKEYQRKKCIAYINAMDIEQPSDLDNESASVLVKMSSLSFYNFRMAFLDPESRIRLNYEKEKSYQSSINHITISGGYLDGLDIDVSENLATIIGGRGTGKSTLINIIRYAVDCEPIGKEAKYDFNEMIKKNLGTGSRVELKVTSYEQFGKSYTITKRYNQNSVISDAEGTVLELGIRDLFPTIEIYGQNEIMEIARDNSRILNVAHRLLVIPKEIEERIAETHKKLFDNGKLLTQLRSEYDSNRMSLEDIPSFQEKLKYYEEAGLKDKLGVFKKLSSEEGQFSAIKSSLKVERPAFPQICIRDYENEELKELASHIMEFNKQMTLMSHQYDDCISKLNVSYDEAYKRWEKNKTQYDEQLKKSLEDLPEIQDKSSREIVDEYSNLIKRVEEAAPINDKQRKIEEQIANLQFERKNLIESYKKACDTRDEHINMLVKSINKKKLRGVVRIAIKYRQNKDGLIDILSNIDGLGEKRLNGIIEYPDFDVITFVEDVKSGTEKLHDKYGLTNDASDKIIQGLSEADLIRIEELSLPDSIEIELKVGDKYKRLKELSKGQQCTAILNILLIDNVDPLIIDQPEDNLDNSFIADNLVRTLRDNKIKRQYIFATHNANIPVFGDSEQIITMEESSGAGIVSANGIGSIDDQGVKDNVISILEGGHTAFKMREEKYGI